MFNVLRMIEQNKQLNRDSKIDSISGSLVILVMLGHWQWLSRDGYVMMLFSFCMCWFFWKAGMFYKIGNKDVLKQLKWMLMKLVVPFVFWGMLGVVLWMFYLKIKGMDSELQSFIYKIEQTPSQILVLKNPPLWFIYPFLFCKIIASLMSRYLNDLSLILIAIVCCVLVCVMHYGGISFGPIVLQTGTLGLMFFVSGYLLKEAQYDHRVFLLALVLFLFLKLLFPSRIMMADNSLLYGTYWSAILSDFAGIIVINNSFKYLTFLDCKILRYIGKYAMVYYMCHAPIMDGIRFWTNDYIMAGWQLKILQTILLVIILQLVVVLFKTPFLSWAIGLKKTR